MNTTIINAPTSNIENFVTIPNAINAFSNLKSKLQENTKVFTLAVEIGIDGLENNQDSIDFINRLIERFLSNIESQGYSLIEVRDFFVTYKSSVTADIELNVLAVKKAG